MHYEKKEITLSQDIIGPRVGKLSKLIRANFNKAVAQQGLFSGQQDIVLALVENPGITLGELAKMLDVSTATMSVSVKRMEKAGFIYKTQDENDARTVRLYPTDKAATAPKKIKAKMDALDTVIKKDMTEKEILEFARLLDKAILNITERGDAQ